MENGNFTEITVKLTRNGLYTWTITSHLSDQDGTAGIEVVKKIDQELKEKFPNHVTRGAGKVMSIDPEDY